MVEDDVCRMLTRVYKYGLCHEDLLVVFLFNRT